MWAPPIDQAQQRAQVVHDGLEPALHQLMHAQPRWQVVGLHASSSSVTVKQSSEPSSLGASTRLPLPPRTAQLEASY